MRSSHSIDPAELAQELADAEARGGWVELFSERVDGFDSAMARAIAVERDRIRWRSGDSRIGYKLGWTSAAMRNALGITKPNWGTLWESQIVVDRLEIADLHHPKVEPELVAEIGHDGAVARWCLGLEVVNPRFESYSFDQLDNTADNSSSARICLGAWTELRCDPSDVEVSFSDGHETAHGKGCDVDGGPAAAVAWLAESLAGEGVDLARGDIVFTGGLTRPFGLVPGAAYELRSDSNPELSTLLLTVES